MQVSPKRASAALALLAASLWLAGSGCSKHTTAPDVVTPAASPRALFTGPAGAVQLFEYACNNRNAALYEGLFTSDYVFAFAPADSAGRVYAERPWLLADEVAYATHIFVGDSLRPPAKSFLLQLDRTLVPLSDPRPGRDPRVHQTIHTTATLNVIIDHGDGSTSTLQIQGYELFYVTRGDSASIPTELLAAGATRDSTIWWIDRWEDETVPPAGGGGGNHADPTQNRTWGWLKTSYR